MTELPIDRRTLLIAAIATAAGLSVPNQARAHGAMSLERAKQIIGDQHKTFKVDGAERQLTAPEITELVTGKTLYGMLYDDEAYILAFNPDGTGVLKIADRPLDKGRWSIDPKTDTITSQWENAADGEALVQNYYTSKQDGVFKTITKPKNRWSMFVMEKGIAPDMTM